mmetsp:Transcript_22309/g.37296  ORF Transcript_22309/g.37296 Transcript_22309/m.37296 type:complete len:145 (+) Transcript_22309:152-586(+)|eukprot:CAMPEP_0198211568 /NCGR_PEP_ID=MMETSP1445-20131203/24505_1 /TAXON_ID=36898 /ORGANISM="Pyramimonas sp., Strain CCMP2087" /LENGTH=144 /DNA_ID=CAMNT_0043885843 /DNA_START=149 /DNA_END=583 /DNA_ORIENTATION=+
MGKNLGQTHKQVMNPYTVDHSWKERINIEQKHAHTFWSKQGPETTEALGMNHTLQRPECLIPKHSYEPSLASSAHSGKTQATRATDVGTKLTALTGLSNRTEATAVLMGRMNQLEKKLADEKKMRGKVEKEVRELMRIRTSEQN